MTMTRPGLARTARTLAIAAIVLSTAACGSKQRQRLAAYDFAGGSVAVVHFHTPPADLVTGRHSTSGNDALATVVSAGSRIAVELEGRRARARLDSAATSIGLASRVAERTLERASAYMGARPVADRAAADYLLEVDLRSLELDTRGDRATLQVRAEVVLLDSRSGRTIWSARVRSHGPLTPQVDGGGIVPAEAVTAGALTRMTVEDFERNLERLGDLAADWISRELRDDLTAARGR
jgi:ABC-type uncharacterized transport system auxiliary subunit